jgi:hypothetical protein
MQPDCRQHLPDDFAAFPPDGGCRQLCGRKCCTVHDSWAVGFAATNRKNILNELSVGTTELHCPQGVFFFHF